METSKKRRRALTNADRLLIRNRRKAYPTTQQNELVDQFSKETGHEVNQSMISKALGAQYDYLDPLNPKADKKALKAVRSSTSDQPDLEGALFKQQQRMQDTDAIITRDILKAQAAKLQRSLPQYAETKEPKWLNGWLEGF